MLATVSDLDTEELDIYDKVVNPILSMTEDQDNIDVTNDLDDDVHHSNADHFLSYCNNVSFSHEISADMQLLPPPLPVTNASEDVKRRYNEHKFRVF